MADPSAMQTEPKNLPVLATPPGSGQAARMGLGSALLGGVCCIGSAIAVGFGVAGLSFFTVWMDRYQIYLIAASVGLMAIWIVRLGRRYGLSGRGLRQAGRMLRRQALVMAGVYAVTLGLAFAAAGLAQAI